MGRTASVGVHFCFDDVEVPGIGLCYIEGYVSSDIVDHGTSFDGPTGHVVTHDWGIDELDISIHSLDKWNDDTEEWEKVELTSETKDKVAEHLFNDREDKLREMLEEESHEEPYHPEA